MARRYRNFKRVSMSAETATSLVHVFVDLPFKEHYLEARCQPASCQHSDRLEVARLVETATFIGKKRAHFDLPDSPALLLNFSKKLRSMAQLWEALHGGESAFAARRSPRWKRHIVEAKKLAEEARAYALRSPLERLAEAGE